MSKPTAIGEILKRQLQLRGVAKKIQEASVANIWAGVVGPEIAAHTSVVKTEMGRAFVAVDSATWRHELMYHKQALLDRINAVLSSNEGGGPVLTDILFTGPQ